MVYRVNAFTESQTGGNPAGVVLDADNLKDNEMLQIAKEVGYSETAFVSKSIYGDYRLRYFTPADEVDLCGHATIAVFTVLFEQGLREGTYKIDTKAGVLPVEVKSNGTILMNQLVPEAYNTVDKARIAESLGIKPHQIIGSPQVFSTGLKDIMVHVRDSATLKSITPDFKLISQISRINESTGYHVFTLDSDKSARCRNFAPLYDIDEEAATGTASGAVSGYIFSNQLIDFDEGLNHLVYEQGLEMNRPSEIHAYIKVDNKKITQVVIGGKGIIQL